MYLDGDDTGCLFHVALDLRFPPAFAVPEQSHEWELHVHTQAVGLDLVVLGVGRGQVALIAADIAVVLDQRLRDEAGQLELL